MTTLKKLSEYGEEFKCLDDNISRPVYSPYGEYKGWGKIVKLECVFCKSEKIVVHKHNYFAEPKLKYSDIRILDRQEERISRTGLSENKLVEPDIINCVAYLHLPKHRGYRLNDDTYYRNRLYVGNYNNKETYIEFNSVEYEPGLQYSICLSCCDKFYNNFKNNCPVFVQGNLRMWRLSTDYFYRINSESGFSMFDHREKKSDIWSSTIQIRPFKTYHSTISSDVYYSFLSVSRSGTIIEADDHDDFRLGKGSYFVAHPYPVNDIID